MNVNDFQKYKSEKHKISIATCYDYWSAKILNQSNIDALLVGDSLAMVMHGYPSTLSADIEMMSIHTKAVARGAPDKFIIVDMPFLSFRKGLTYAMEATDRLMKAGAQAIKLEGVEGHQEIVKHIAQSGIPIMGHLGLTPQSIHQFGGHKVQGKGARAEEKMLHDAHQLEMLGCFAIVLECIPAALGEAITDNLSIPTIGIGAGASVDGQVLVLQDMLGMDQHFNPKFLRKYLNGEELILSSINRFVQEVKEITFPNEQESY